MIANDHQDEIQAFLKDASNMPGGFAERVYFPETEADVITVLTECNASGTPVTIAGAGTGLAGGRVPFGGVVISMSRLNHVIVIDPERSRAIVEPGVVLGQFQLEIERQGLFYPPDPTERNCFIGATVATNSSGARTFKYGPTRDYITGLRVVLSTGELVILQRGENFAGEKALSIRTEAGRVIDLQLPDLTMPSTKNAAGYYVKPQMDAIDLFIGSEGTLGVITYIEVHLLPFPESLFSGVVFFPDEGAMLSFVDEARTRSRNLSKVNRGFAARALEFMDANALEFIRERYPAIPINAAGGAIWFEQETTYETEEWLMGEWYDMMVRHSGLTEESWYAIGTEDQRRLREFRHAIPSAVYEHITSNNQVKLGTDMAVPDGKLPELLRFYREQFRISEIRNVIYGHIGDNHLHANMLTAGEDELTKARELYNRFVTKALGLGGTISAEHGVGKIKTDYLIQMYGDDTVEKMRLIKYQLDPNGILGQGTVLRSF